jgi:2-polyprenyl-3-methyl-5-hydroxy-6-metoxy-1,4-benzoquinol methylase
MKAVSDVATDFDRIASALAETPANAALTAAERAVIRAVPAGAHSALDVGCGDGRLALALAARGVAVLAIDVAPRMIALARERADPRLSVDYRVANIMTDEMEARTFDAVLCVNVVHHLPLPLVVPRLASFVAPGGTLVIQDVVTRTGLRHFPRNVVGGIAERVARFIRSNAGTRRVQQLYDEHGRGEAYLRPENVATALGPFLPGVAIAHHLGWRYTAVWHAPRAPGLRR